MSVVSSKKLGKNKKLKKDLFDSFATYLTFKESRRAFIDAAIKNLEDQQSPQKQISAMQKKRQHINKVDLIDFMQKNNKAYMIQKEKLEKWYDEEAFTKLHINMKNRKTLKKVEKENIFNFFDKIAKKEIDILAGFGFPDRKRECFNKSNFQKIKKSARIQEVGSEVYKEAMYDVISFLEDILPAAIDNCTSMHRKKITLPDILYALKKSGNDEFVVQFT